ncbi:DUF2945 domain-containing protein [Paracoccus sp. YIM 132242]|uniref:DUF2945 domain-containing protein n=1 Tax=Paracoccus lichenicola TaxID=2665644 RepID=A0A6L6HNW7_9RHOB|nr:DUF2945 domain-containing protein [Paracoccus lichenicola]MTE00854.1 DUF2945 domain-containing protein [Paracoccus lichenicola]
MSKFRVGTAVEWDWGKGTATGTITESFTEPVERTIKGATIKRNADPENPAYLIEQDDGDRVLKSHSELRKAT